MEATKRCASECIKIKLYFIPANTLWVFYFWRMFLSPVHSSLEQYSPSAYILVPMACIGLPPHGCRETALLSESVGEFAPHFLHINMDVLSCLTRLHIGQNMQISHHKMVSQMGAPAPSDPPVAEVDNLYSRQPVKFHTHREGVGLLLINMGQDAKR